jgi:predicted nucleotidyltransferase
MSSLADASLTPVERRVLERLVRLLRAEYGDDLHGVWLYGSRARGEPPHPETDVDLLVVAPRGDWRSHLRVSRLVDEAATAEGANPFDFAALVYDPERVAQRRRIRSFFIQEVDRDKIVLAGEP